MNNKVGKNNKFVNDKYVIAAFLLKVDSNGKTSKRTIISNFDRKTSVDSKIKLVQQYNKWINSLNPDLFHGNWISSLESQKERFGNQVSYSIQIFLIKGHQYFFGDYSLYPYITTMYNRNEYPYKNLQQRCKVTTLTDIQNVQQELVELVEGQLNLIMN